jgi:hypothetical protein
MDAASDGTSFRDRRRSRLAESHRRHEILSAAAPSGDPQFINAIAAADRFWGANEQWRLAATPRIHDAVKRCTTSALSKWTLTSVPIRLLRKKQNYQTCCGETGISAAAGEQGLLDR